MGKAQITEQDLQEDFILFLHYMWTLLNLPPPTKCQVLMAEWIQDRSKRQRGVMAYRGAGKSYIAYTYCVWRMWKDPHIKILVVSATSGRADAFSRTCKQMLELSPILSRLIPDKGSNNQWSNTEWSIQGSQHASGSCTVKSVGIGSQITGTRADLILSDDVSSPKNSMTVDQREKLREQIAEFQDIKKADESGTGQGADSEILYLGTPQSHESLYYHLANKGVKFRIWPARYPREDDVQSYMGMLCPVLENELFDDLELQWVPTDPKRFTDDELNEREMFQGKARFQMQFMLNTELSDADKFPLKLSDLVIYTPSRFSAPRQVSHSIDPKLEIKELRNVGFSSDRWRRPSYIDEMQLPFERIILVVDPSGRGTDEVGWDVLGTLMGSIYLLDAGGFDGGYDEDRVLIPLAKKAREWDIHIFLSESNFGGGMFTELMKGVMYKYHKCVFEEVHNTIRKEHRIIDTLEPLMARHKLIVSENVVTNDLRDAERMGKEGSNNSRLSYSLFYQLTHITAEKDCLIHDDRLDALAIGVGFLVDEVDRDSDEEVHRMKDQAIQDILMRKGRVTIGDVEHSKWGDDIKEHTDFGRTKGQGGYYSILDS